jgi:hypothetical protein
MTLSVALLSAFAVKRSSPLWVLKQCIGVNPALLGAFANGVLQGDTSRKQTAKAYFVKHKEGGGRDGAHLAAAGFAGQDRKLPKHFPAPKPQGLAKTVQFNRA